MNGAFAVKVIEAKEQFATDDSDVGFGKDTGFKKIKTRTAFEELHNDPQLVVDHERSIIARDVFRVALGEAGDFLLDFGDVVIGILEIYNPVRAQK